jgi:hypothetical protein
MYVRWQLYKSQAVNPVLAKRNDEHARLKAILAESVRVNGKPTQKHIAFLGSTSIDGADRMRFWHDVTTRLNTLQLPMKTRKQIVAAIVKKLGAAPPSKAQLAQFKRDRDKLMSGASLIFR